MDDSPGNSSRQGRPIRTRCRGSATSRKERQRTSQRRSQSRSETPSSPPHQSTSSALMPPPQPSTSRSSNATLASRQRTFRNTAVPAPTHSVGRPAIRADTDPEGELLPYTGRRCFGPQWLRPAEEDAQGRRTPAGIDERRRRLQREKKYRLQERQQIARRTGAPMATKPSTEAYYYNIGAMNAICFHCMAKHFQSERAQAGHFSSLALKLMTLCLALTISLVEEKSFTALVRCTKNIFRVRLQRCRMPRPTFAISKQPQNSVTRPLNWTLAY